MTIVTRCRVAVVGAGPAGCAAALAATRAGISDVVLVERGTRGKDKACGDAFLPDAVRLLETLGVGASAFTQRGRRFSAISLWGDGRPVWEIPLGTTDGWIAPRAHVDQALREVVAEAVPVHYGASIQRVERLAGSTWALSWRADSVDHTIVTDGVILATGAARSLAERWQVDGGATIGASVSGYVDAVRVDSPVFEFIHGELPGYGWAFPLPCGRANVGYCATLRTSGLRSASERYLRRWSSNRMVRLRGGVGPMWSGLGERWHHLDGLTSCGDAAGLVDPLTGEGITAALESGLAAGRAVAEFVLSGRDVAPLVAYSRWVGSTYRQRYRPTAVRRTWASLAQMRVGA